MLNIEDKNHQFEYIESENLTDIREENIYYKDEQDGEWLENYNKLLISIEQFYDKKEKSGNKLAHEFLTKDEYKYTYKVLQNFVDIDQSLLPRERTLIKKPWERLVEYLDYKSEIYIFYPDIAENDFYKKIYLKKEFQMNKQIPIDITKYEDIQKELCPNEKKNFKLQSHQKLIKNYLSRNTNFNGLLIFHGTGTGKTCSSITIAETYKNLISLNSKKILVILSKSVKSNFIKEIHNVGKGYNQCTGSDYLNYDIFSNQEKKKKNVLSLIDKFYDLMTYGKFKNEISKQLDLYDIHKYKFSQQIPDDLIKWIDLRYSDRVIIVDEVHNLKNYKDDEEMNDIMDENDIEVEQVSTKKLKRYDALELILKYSRNVKLILLSATPMYHKPVEIISIFNLLLLNDDYDRIEATDIFDGHSLTESGENTLRIISQGYVSYVRTESPYTFAERRYPNSIPIHSYINKKIEQLKKIYKIKKTIRNNDYNDLIHIIPSEMSIEHDKFYKKKIKTEVLSKIIEYGNFGRADIHKISQKKLLLSELQNTDTSISTKLGNLIHNIINNPSRGTYFLFSYYVSYGVEIIARALLANGISLVISNTYGKLILADPKTIKSMFKQSLNQPSKDEQICYKDAKTREYYKNNMDEFKPMTFAYIIGKTEENQRDGLISSFNENSNKYGNDIKIMLGSSVFKEGISLYNVRQIHLLEPWHNRSRIEQVIGRGIRHCSHQQLLPKERNVSIYQYVSIYNTKVDNIAMDGDIDRRTVKQIVNIFTKNLIIDTNLISSEIAKLNIFHYDILMYMRSQILNNLIVNIQNILRESAVDCTFNQEINIKTLKDKDKYQCQKKIDFSNNDIGNVIYMTDKDYDIKEEDIDYSTFDDVFYQPYITYVINLIKRLFESDEGIYILTFNDIKEHVSLIDNPIYYEKNNYIIRAAIYSIIPKDYTNIDSVLNIIRKRIGRRYIFGYMFGRNTPEGGIFIFQPFENQIDVYDIGKKLIRSDFERSPMYEKTGFEQSIEIESPFNEINENKYNEIIYGKTSIEDADIIDISVIKKKKVKKVTELIKERDISITNENEKIKNAPLIGLIIDITSIDNFNKSVHLWGLVEYHIWLREKRMICKEGKRESFGQFSLSFNLEQLKCIIGEYILTKEHKSVINTVHFLEMMRNTKDKKALLFIKDIEMYTDIYEWWNLRITKPKNFKLVLKKQDVANLIYLFLKYFEKINISNKIWIRNLY